MGTVWLLLVWVLMCWPAKGLHMTGFGGTKGDNEELQGIWRGVSPNHISIKTLGLVKSMDSMSENQVKEVLLETNEVETHTSFGRVRLQGLDRRRKLKDKEASNEITVASINVTVPATINGAVVGGKHFVTGAIGTVVLSNGTVVASNESVASTTVTVFVGNQTVASANDTNRPLVAGNVTVAITNGTVVDHLPFWISASGSVSPFSFSWRHCCPRLCLLFCLPGKVALLVLWYSLDDLAVSLFEIHNWDVI
ncbi:uncharacterized protein LOC124875650 [Girardinichthys multiradiatus]|uniref:uncharacterized protein LOC124875650 n=1 Tax=Girardinichthys multiradiatus TaxID=208333 RepID=UPI001FAD981C|nr:uncharacterized protein LOC124875650 [Girardinichthys multiradiatus]